jgi:hypothetical protein
MKNLLRVVCVVFTTLLLISPAVPQQPVAPPPPPRPAAGPSLAVTMQFIQDKLNDNGKASWIDSTQGVLGALTDTVTHETSNIVADQSQCRISYHLFTKHTAPYRWVPTSDGKNNKGVVESFFSLRAVQEIVVKPWEQYETEWLAKNGHPDTTVTSVNPPMTVLVVRQPHGVENVFTFTDAALADRIAKAMVHAVELCGGGKTEEPF